MPPAPPPPARPAAPSPGPILLGFSLGLVVFETITGLVVALRAKLDFLTYAFLMGHRNVAAMLSLLLLLVYFPVLFRRSTRSFAAGLGYSLLCIALVYAPFTDVFFQLIYLVAAAVLALCVVWGVRRSGEGSNRPWTERVTLWLLALPVFVVGWHLILFPYVRSDIFDRNDLYYLFHRYGSLAAAIGFPIVLGPGLLSRGARAVRTALITAGLTVLILLLLTLHLSLPRNTEGFAENFKPLDPPTPALPLLVRTSEEAPGRELIPRSLIRTSAECGSSDCHNHDTVYSEWLASPHRFSGRTEPYKRLVRQLAREKGRPTVLRCSRCHTPWIAAAGLVDDPDDPAQEALREEGVSCQYCHLVRAVQMPPGDGLLTVGFEPDYLAGYDLAGETARKFRDTFLMANPLPHQRMHTPPVQFRSEFCAACHMTSRSLATGGGPGRARGSVHGEAYHSWVASPAARDGIGCQACHMPLSDVDAPGVDRHAVADHRFIAPGRSLAGLVPGEPGLADYESRVAPERSIGEIRMSRYENVYLWFIGNRRHRAFEEYLSGRTPLRIEIVFAGPATPGGLFHWSVRTWNETAAHAWPVGTPGFSETWLEVEVADRSGQMILRTPGLDENGRLSPEAPSLGGTLLDAEGRPVTGLRFWLASRIEGERILDLDRPRTDDFELRLPDPVLVPLRVRARWCFRRYAGADADLLLGPGSADFPVAVLAERTETVPGESAPQAGP